MEAEDVELLVKKLLDKTKSKEVQWGQTSRTSEYVVTLESGSVTSDYQENRGAEPFCDFAIYNKKGDKIYAVLLTPGEPLFGLLVNLNQAAQENFYRTGETFQSMIAELGKAGPVGGKPIAL